jgi:predicted SprT family Zn-dependent metalloprotease
MEQLQVWNRLRLVLAEIDAHAFGNLQSHIPDAHALTEIKRKLSELSEEDSLLDSFVTAPSHNSPIQTMDAKEVFNLDTSSEDSFIDQDDVIELESNRHLKLESPDKTVPIHEMFTPWRSHQPDDNEMVTTHKKSKKFVISSSDSDSVQDSPIKKGRPRVVICLSSDSEDDEPPPIPKKSSGKKQKQEFQKQREIIAREWFAKFNEAIFDGKLEPDMELEWNNRLRTTAGRTHSTRTLLNDQFTYSSKIVLSSNILDTKDKLENTLVHEMCHAAVACIDKLLKAPPHGTEFKHWAGKVTRAFPHLQVSTCHNYEIEFKYTWECTGCKRTVGRHSKSIAVGALCGRCHSELKPLFQESTRAPTAFTQFLKENMATVKQSMPGSPHKMVMQTLSQRFRQGTSPFSHFKQ